MGEFAKMLLGAAGIDGKFTGSSWLINVTVAAQNAGILTSKDVVTDPASRDAVAGYTFETLQYAPDGKSTEYVVYNDADNDTVLDDNETVIYRGTDAVTALLMKQSNAAYEIALVTKNAGSLADTVFKLSSVSSGVTDDFGRPATSWKQEGKTDPIATTVSSAVKTYLEGFDSNELTALKNEGYTFTGASIVANGADAGIGNVEALAARDYTGTIVELYNTDSNAKTIEKIVLVQAYLTKVTNVVSSNKTATSNYITLAVYNPWNASDVVNVTFNDTASTTVASTYDKLVAEYAKDEFLLTYWKGADVAAANYISAEDAASVVATVNSTKMTDAADGYNGTIVAGSNTYSLASGYAEEDGFGGALTLGKEYTLYFDANGYVIGAVPVSAAAATVHYGIVLDKASANGVGENNLSGEPAKAAYENVQIFTSTGDVVVFGTAFKLASDGLTISKKVVDESIVNGTLVSYTLDAAGKINSMNKAIDDAALEGAHVKGNAFQIVDGSYATAQTVTFVMKTTGSDDGAYTKDDIAVYTGYANVPAATYTAGKAIDSTSDSAGALVVKAATLPESTTKAQYVVLTDGVPTVTATDKTGEFRYTYDAIVDGQATTIFYLASSAPDVADNLNKVCTVEFSATTGAVASMTPVGADIDEITTSQDTFYADGSVVYVDEDTVFYQLEGTFTADGATTITGYHAVDGITLAGSGDTFEVYEYYVQAGTNAADVVFYFVYQP